MLGMHAEFARFRSEQVSFNADNVASVKKLVECKIVLRDGVLSNIDLQFVSSLLQMRETSLPHQPFGCNPPGNAHTDARLKLLRGLVAVLRQNLRKRVAEIETLAIGSKAERLDLRDTPDALIVQIVFQ